MLKCQLKEVAERSWKTQESVVCIMLIIFKIFYLNQIIQREKSFFFFFIKTVNYMKVNHSKEITQKR